MERHIPWFDRGLHKILWQGHTCNSIPATCWVKFQLVWICVSWSRDRMWRQVPPPLPSWQTLCCVVLLKNLLWGQNLSLQHVALNSAGLSLCVMKQGHDAEASPLIWLDFMKRFLVLGDKIFTPQHVAAWNSAGLNLCIMKRVHDDHIIGTVPATSPLASMSWLLSHCFKVWWVAFKLQI